MRGIADRYAAIGHRCVLIDDAREIDGAAGSGNERDALCGAAGIAQRDVAAESRSGGGVAADGGGARVAALNGDRPTYREGAVGVEGRVGGSAGVTQRDGVGGVAQSARAAAGRVRPNIDGPSLNVCVTGISIGSVQYEVTVLLECYRITAA